MEKILTPEEKIRRAEEIYQRRREAVAGKIRVSSNSVNNKRSRLTLFKKMAVQLAICAVIYIIFYMIKNTNYIFSEDVIQKTKEVLSYDINFQNLYNQISVFLQENETSNEITNEMKNEIANETTNEIQENDTNEVKNEETNQESNTNETENEEVNTQTNEIKEKETGGIRGSSNE